MITVFIGTFNRLSTLERTIKSYKKFKTPHELVIVDNGSDHPRCIEMLNKLEKHVKKIYRLPGCNSMEEATHNFNIAIRDQFEKTDSKWFAISEADVCFEGTDAHALDVYTRIAKEQGTAVGPHLRVSDIPAHYPLRSRVLACESRLLYKDEMEESDGVFFSKCQIDTTFHLFPRTREFRRLHLNPIRVGPPYDALHLDWYLNIFYPSAENRIYIGGTRPIGSWGKAWLRDYWGWFQYDPTKALENLLQESPNPRDLCNNSFMLSWAYQYGQGCEPDHEKSLYWLKLAIPHTDNRYYWPYEENWLKMVYDSDFSSLGWT